MGGVVGDGVSEGVGDAEADMDEVAVMVADVDGDAVAVVDLDGVAVLVAVTVVEHDGDPVTDRLGEPVDVDDGVMLGVTLGEGVGQGTVAVSDIMAFMRRSTLLSISLVNNSPMSVIATPFGHDHLEVAPPVLER